MAVVSACESPPAAMPPGVFTDSPTTVPLTGVTG